MLIWCGKRGERFLSSVFLLSFTLFFSVPFFFIVLKTFFSGEFGFWDLVFFSCSFFSFSVFLTFFVFAVKFPVFLFHSWLPRAHVEAPTIGSVILAACVLKLGSYGVCRVLFVLGGSAKSWFVCLGCLGAFASCLVCFFSSDLKSLVAFSRVFHISFLFCSVVFSSERAFIASLVVSVSHGFCSALLFFYVGGGYDFFHSRSVVVVRGFNCVFGLAFL